ncbi:MAG: DNA repair protein RecN [Pseudomonadota bacterium]|nr:DNA repair protein RecN [Pseudomonadota bacterium]
MATAVADAMLRALSIRNFVVVETLDIDFGPGFTVLTGETGAGKSILLDALGLLLGDRFELRQLRPGAARAELAAVFDIGDTPSVASWLEAEQLDAGGELLLRRVQEAQGRSRAWINGRPATLSQLVALGAQLLDLHGQHAHQTLVGAEAQRTLLDEFGGFTVLTRDVAEAWHASRAAIERRDAAATAAQAFATERETLDERQRELAELGLAPDEWATLGATQRRLANAAGLIEATTQAEEALVEGDDALGRRLARIVQKLAHASQDDPALADIVALLAPAAIQLDEAARAVREYRRRLDLDPDELARVEQRLSAIHDAARKHRVRPEALQGLAQSIAERLSELTEAADAEALARAADKAGERYDQLAATLSSKRVAAAPALAHRVTATMQELAMTGGRFDVALEPASTAASFGRESVVFRIATHPKQALGPLSRIASGGELSRVALAIQIAASEVGRAPTLVFDEVDTGIGGAVAATVGRMLQTLGERRQVLCVTHLPQVAAHADHHFRVVKTGNGEHVTSELMALARAARVDELARMLAGSEITSKTRAHASELYDQHRRKGG